MPSFINPALLAGLAILAIPVIIHLINLLRHRRVQWAAMEFLLESQKRNSRWVLIKQLLLLLLRMGAIAAVVLILAQPLLRSNLGRLLGGATTHHIVLLDDSFSMSERGGASTAFDNAKTAITELARQAIARREDQIFTLLTFSQGPRSQVVLNQEPVNADFAATLDAKLRQLQPTELASGPSAALESFQRLLGEAEDENRIVYLVTDFRVREWDQPGEAKRKLQELSDAQVRLSLIDCAAGASGNLTVTALRPQRGTRAAGVPAFMEVAVTNYSNEIARNVALSIAQRESDESWRARPEELLIDEIASGKTEVRRFPVLFTTAGEHQLRAELKGDSVVLADNSRYTVVDVPLGVPVLIIDGDPKAEDAFFVASALAPPGSTRSGISPQVETPAFLNNNPLAKFRSIYLVNLDRLDQAGIRALEAYVVGGGGLAIFLGDLSQARFLNEQLYRNGAGLFPLPVSGPAELRIDRLDKAPDLAVSDHPIFKIFAGERNSFLGAVGVQRYFSPQENWSPAPDSTVKVIAGLRNSAPLAVERRFGNGRVVAFLTTAAPLWNNWARNPSFVVAMQELQAYLAAIGPAEDAHQVGAPLKLVVDPARYEPELRLVPPTERGLSALALKAQPTADGLDATFTDTAAAGVYQAELTTSDGKPEVRRYAYNVVPEEGDLKTLGGPQLAARLKGVKYDYQPAQSFQSSAYQAAGFNLSEGILYLLIVLLLGEQFLAYAASYHPPVRGGARG